MDDRKREFERLKGEANAAKDRLASIASRLEDLGYIRKSKSLMGIVYDIEDWQRKGA